MKSQTKFMNALLTAAALGSKLWIGDPYKKSLFNGHKPFTDNLKSEFRNKDNLTELKIFFGENIDDIGKALSELGIPEKAGEANLEALAYALAMQLKLIIDSAEEDVEDIVALEYQEAKSNNVKTTEDIAIKPLYIGDSVNVFQERKHEIQSYDKVMHTWEIYNNGKIMWTGRKLLYMRKPKDRPEANPSAIDIPDVEPKKSIKITTTFDGRGFDGITNCIWEMQDANGNNCFPQRESLFAVKIDAKYRRK